MATLVLTVVGGLIGGPVGAMIGAAAGQQIDRKLFGPKGGQGPRLSDLAVQTSTYGSPIPKLFGAVRVAGTVIWATDLVETRSKVSSGKGQPKTTVYAYHANFAVALSARRILRIGRIWADGKLLRGAAGDFKTATQFRLHLGTDDQAADPLIVAAEASGATPAYRGTAYAVFEDFALEAYGNRIPSLSFEVFADETPVSLGRIVSDLSEQGVADAAPTLLDGFAATGDNIRSIVSLFSDSAGLRLIDNGNVLLLAESGGTAPSPAPNDLGATASHEMRPRIRQERSGASAMPNSLAMRYLDPDRDYQPGMHRSVRAGGAVRELRLDMPATLTSGHAAALAEGAMARRVAAQDRVSLTLPWRALGLKAGQDIALPGTTGVWRISAISVEAMVVALTLERQPDALPVSTSGSGGRIVGEEDLQHGPTHIALLDLPATGDSVATIPNLVVAASGESAGWRRAALLVSADDGVSWQEVGATAPSAVVGVALTALPPSSSELIDMAHHIDVELRHDSMDLADADMTHLLAGANAAILGQELIQFATATPIAPRRYRLSGLLRGRRGTEWAKDDHAVGDRFVLLDPLSLLPVPVPVGSAAIAVMAAGIGDTAPYPQDSVMAPGAALRPLSPVHLTATGQSNGDTYLRWIRRSRDGWRWVDLVDAPLAEEQERYHVEIVPNVGATRSLTVTSPEWTYPSAEQQADLLAGVSGVTINVRQDGIFGQSRAASLLIPLN
jgi:hypothetical protein